MHCVMCSFIDGKLPRFERIIKYHIDGDRGGDTYYILAVHLLGAKAPL